jgi:hypothetical protein
MRFMIVFAFLIQAALAQHGSASAGGRGFAGHAMGRAPMARTRGGFGARIGSPFIGPYWPDYGFASDYYGEEPSGPPNGFFLTPPAIPSQPVRLPQTVIHEYTVPAGDAGSSATAFTIALKDGSQQSASAAWIQAGKLHYLDSQDRQQVLSPDVIDRPTTERLNEEKHLRLQLPPG